MHANAVWSWAENNAGLITLVLGILGLLVSFFFAKNKPSTKNKQISGNNSINVINGKLNNVGNTTTKIKG
ncbi:MAG: hypothetical protein K0R14_1069 [Burkholderiales bacterium]|jgi:hypothetical protein|nr:hypothetical protein [Burkholderiales bacterium]